MIDLFALFCMSCAFICVGSRDLFHNFLYISSLVSCVVSNISICLYLRIYLQYTILWLFIFWSKNTQHMFIKNISTNRYGYICYVSARMLSLSGGQKGAIPPEARLWTEARCPQKNDAKIPWEMVITESTSQLWIKDIKDISKISP